MTRDDPDEPTRGRDVVAVWLAALDLNPVTRWHVEVALEAGHATRFTLNVYAEEWGFAFHHSRRSSWIRVTDVPFIHGRDDFGLLAKVPELPTLNTFICELEAHHRIEFLHATVRSNLPNAAQGVHRWLAYPLIGQPTARERCEDEMHDGIRCMRERGHGGHHVYANTEGVLRWKQTR